jgi:hypothetical protein
MDIETLADFSEQRRVVQAGDIEPGIVRARRYAISSSQLSNLSCDRSVGGIDHPVNRRLIGFLFANMDDCSRRQANFINVFEALKWDNNSIKFVLRKWHMLAAPHLILGLSILAQIRSGWDSQLGKPPPPVKP